MVCLATALVLARVRRTGLPLDLEVSIDDPSLAPDFLSPVTSA
jgi:hypothetical protein